MRTVPLALLLTLVAGCECEGNVHCSWGSTPPGCTVVEPNACYANDMLSCCGGTVTCVRHSCERVAVDCPEPDGGALDASVDTGAVLDAAPSDVGSEDAAVSSDAPAGDTDDAALPPPTDAERAACVAILAIAPCSPIRDEATCFAQLVERRLESEAAGCQTEYDALIACMAALTECPPGSGFLCPDESAPLADCLRGP